MSRPMCRGRTSPASIRSSLPRPSNPGLSSSHSERPCVFWRRCGFSPDNWPGEQSPGGPEQQAGRDSMFRKTLAVTAMLGAAVAIGFAPAARADESPPLKIALFTGYSGPFAIFGQEADAAVAAFRKEHGDVVAGRKVVILKRDTTGPNPDVVHRLAQEAITRDHVDVIIAGDYTPNALAIAGPSAQAHVPVLIANAATTSILERSPSEVRLGFTTSQVAVPYAKWAVAHGYKRIFANYTDYGPGIEAGAAFKKSLAEAGGTLAGEVKP